MWLAERAGDPDVLSGAGAGAEVREEVDGQESARAEGRREQPSSDEAALRQGTAAETERGGGADIRSHV